MMPRGIGSVQPEGAGRNLSRAIASNTTAASAPSNGAGGESLSGFIARDWKAGNAGWTAGGHFHRDLLVPDSNAQSDFARSRSTNFWIFPVDVFGSGPNTTVRGVL